LEQLKVSSYDALMTSPGLRERKKQRTRQALYEAATRLFLAQGYARTTVAEIAAEAGVSEKTLFNYFSSKEDLLFRYRYQRIAAMELGLVEELRHTTPEQALARIVEQVVGWALSGEEPGKELSLAQARLILVEPELRARSLDVSWELEHRLAAVLHETYPERFDAITAASLVGAMLGALGAAMRVAIEHVSSPDELRAVAHHAIATVSGTLPEHDCPQHHEVDGRREALGDHPRHGDA
jgi:AcrR family transcriptional regulator